MSISSNNISKLPSNFESNLYKIDTLGGGSCFFATIVSALLPEYHLLPINEQVSIVANFRRDLAWILIQPNPNYPDIDSVEKLWIDNPPFNNTQERDEFLELTGKMNCQREQYSEFLEQNNINVNDRRLFENEYTSKLPINCYYYTLNKGKYPYLIDYNGKQKIISFEEFYLGVLRFGEWADGHIIKYVADVLGISCLLCETRNGKLVNHGSISSDNPAFYIIINHPPQHFELIGKLYGSEMQVIFHLEDPIYIKWYESAR